MTTKLEHIILKYLNQFYGDLTETTHPEFPRSVFYYRGEKVYMEHGPGYDDLYITNDYIWADLEYIFSLDSVTIREIIKKWVNITYNITNVHPLRTFSLYSGLGRLL